MFAAASSVSACELFSSATAAAVPVLDAAFVAVSSLTDRISLKAVELSLVAPFLLLAYLETVSH